MKIYLKPRPSGKKFRSLYTFLKYYFTCMGADYRGGFPESYKDAACTVKQCRAGAYRSFDELVIMCQTYFNNATPELVAKALYKLFPQTKVCLYYCPDVDKVVLFMHTRSNETMYDSIYDPEWDSCGAGIHTPNMIKALIEQ